MQSLMLDLRDAGAFRANVMEDLEALIVCPETASYWARIDLRAATSSLLALMKHSVVRKEEMVYPRVFLRHSYSSHLA
ncbi:hypothetical protein Bca101_058532 [Brassica carinata]